MTFYLQQQNVFPFIYICHIQGRGPLLPPQQAKLWMWSFDHVLKNICSLLYMHIKMQHLIKNNQTFIFGLIFDTETLLHSPIFPGSGEKCVFPEEFGCRLLHIHQKRSLVCKKRHFNAGGFGGKLVLEISRRTRWMFMTQLVIASTQ